MFTLYFSVALHNFKTNDAAILVTKDIPVSIQLF